MNRKQMNKALGLTEEELDTSAAAYENDTWDSSALGKVIHGRPSIADEEVRPVTVRLPLSQLIALDGKARREGETRSAVVRQAIEGWLAQA